jgi:hypothetical protein
MTKKGFWLLSLLITLIGITAFGINKGNLLADSNTVKKKNPLFNPIDPLPIYYDFYADELDDPLSFNNENLVYSVINRYERTITKEKIRSASSLADLIVNYPSSWIYEYDYVEINTKNSFGVETTRSKDNILTKEQKDLFYAADIDTEINIKVHFKTENFINKNIENHEMDLSYVVTPEIEAEYKGGYEQLIDYLKLNSQDELSAYDLSAIESAIIQFTINEKGEVENEKLDQSCGITEIDELMLGLIRKMPKWQAAKDLDAKNVKQQFVFMVGIGGC